MKRTATETYYEDLKAIFPTLDKKQFIIKPFAIEDLEKQIRAELIS
jgi:hypothetical protein